MVLMIVAMLFVVLAYAWNASYQPSSFYMCIIVALGFLLMLSVLRKAKKERLVTKCLLICLVCIGAVFIPLKIMKHDDGALAYWGTIVGGMISGGIAVIGVFATIRYYRQSDAEKARISVRPFFEVVVTSAYPVDTIPEKAAWIAPTEDDALRKFKIKIRNIGDGFAQINSVGRTREDQSTFCRIVYSQEIFELILYLPESPHNDEFSFLINFEDALGNAYSQEVTVVKKRSDTNFHSYYGATKQPVFVMNFQE